MLLNPEFFSLSIYYFSNQVERCGPEPSSPTVTIIVSGKNITLIHNVILKENMISVDHVCFNKKRIRFRHFIKEHSFRRMNEALDQ